MKQISSTLGLLLVLSLSLPTYASEVAAAVPPQPSTDDWSIGAGFSIPGLTYSSVGYVGGLSAVTVAPSTSMALERRLSDTLWLTMGFSGSVSTLDDQASLDNGATIVTDTLSTEVALGLRYLFNPRGAVELSVFGGLSLAYGDSTWKSDSEDWTNRTLSYGLVAGLALERRLMDNLYLRFQTTMGNVFYSSVETKIDGTAGTTNTSQFRGGIALSPGIQLRLTF